VRYALLIPIGLLALSLASPTQAANFGAHAGLANGVWADPYFRAGALLADVDHFLPPGEPRTDDIVFTQGLVSRAWPLSRNAWRFATGWHEHLDQDNRFAESVARVQSTYPAYSDPDVRLAFDYWTLTKHRFPTDYDWILTDAEILELVAGGLVGTDANGVRAAVDDLLHSADLSNPGLALQLDAARLYGFAYPARVADMEAEYDRFYGRVTAGYVAVFPRIDVTLRVMASTVRRSATNPDAVMPYLSNAMALEAGRPAGWMAQEVATLSSFVDALPAAGLPTRSRLLLQERAWQVIGLLD